MKTITFEERKEKQTINRFLWRTFTVLTYMFEGGTQEYIKYQTKLRKKEMIYKTLELVTEFSILYLKEQIRNGVDIKSL